MKEERMFPFKQLDFRKVNIFGFLTHAKWVWKEGWGWLIEKVETHIVTSPFLIPKLAMYIVNMMYGRGPSDVICK
jgi:hypothetical protein